RGVSMRIILSGIALISMTVGVLAADPPAATAPATATKPAAAATAPAVAAPSAAPALPPVSYNKQIWPVIQRQCQGCHQPAKQGGKLLLISYDDFKTGG